MTRLLLEAGADACHRAHAFNRETALLLACQISFPGDPRIIELVKILLDHGATKIIDMGERLTPLGWAARRRDLPLIRLLLDSGSNINAKSASGISPLLAGCGVRGNRNLESLLFLLDAGASVNTKRGSDGRTPLHLAAGGCGAPLAARLLDLGANVSVYGVDGSLPLHDAVRECDCSLIAIILDAKGSMLDLNDGSGRTPLEIAVDNRYWSVIDLLVSAGAGLENERWALQRMDDSWEIQRRDRIYWPQTPRDVYKVFWLLRYHTKLKFNTTAATVTQILDRVEYWIQSESRRKDEISVDENTCKSSPPYLISRPIVSKLQSPVKRIIFVIDGHDQGYSDFPLDHGTFENSWTWFEVEVTKSDGVLIDFEEESKILATNVHASRMTQQHRIMFGDQPGMRQSRWFRKLGAGDTISIRPRAKYSGWVNYVEKASTVACKIGFALFV